MDVDGLIGPELWVGQVRLWLVPRSEPRSRCPIKPPGHTSKPPWRSVKRDLGLCPV
ncbi:uncharacterized protein PGTG_09565 [Puccinia graminis f. sp. tritici CRL 75-36-700-3]|uniref:Uncharacterized protein n=1 Tax=Puccinia graminis f. sp. tritici (strain CRL 75-36-700-3 / race SCCL) TaxID=418459 RepID=E3KHS7_PUCGT|nr:uncharacterized protein PGTG_09565 [Puccinia graminis f. sp. tritici CRL 75-36-700-3]EFP83852.2 hypothetical protein PGTG_09565 [Puccinia graminis f. sp. tritici CRL 75-36-700-3]